MAYAMAAIVHVASDDDDVDGKDASRGLPSSFIAYDPTPKVICATPVILILIFDSQGDITKPNSIAMHKVLAYRRSPPHVHVTPTTKLTVLSI